MATLLPDGKALVGGIRGSDTYAFGYLAVYDPATDTFTPQTFPGEGEYPSSAALLPNGKVLLAVGVDEWYSDAAGLYDPATGTTTVERKMDAWLMYPMAVLLPNGRAIVTGRDDSMYKSGFDGSVRLYDPSTDSFAPPVGINHAEGFSSTLLQDGTVLIGAGWVCCGRSINTVDIYRPDTLVPAPSLLGVLHASTHAPVSQDAPAMAGEALEIYGSGLMDDSVIPPQATIGGRMADVLYYGKAPGFAGLNQINVRVPAAASAGAAPLQLRYIGRFSNTLSIAVR